MAAPRVKTKYPGIYRRGSRYSFPYTDPQGKQRWGSARTLSEAREAKAATTADVMRGEYRAMSRITFAEYAPEWANTYTGRTRRGVRPETIRDYRRALGIDDDGNPTGAGAVAYFDRMRLTEIEPRDIKAYATKIASTGAARDTVRLALAPVKALLATAVEEGLIRSNPSAGLRLIQAREDGPERRVKALTETDLKALIEATPKPWRLIVEFLAQTGLRISEALALTWGDVDFGRRRVRVERRLRDGRVGPLKSSYARREVPISVAMGQALWRARGNAGDDDLVFSGRGGRMLDRGQVYRAVKESAKKADVPWAGLHTLRHTCATLAFNSGWNGKQVQMLLGHHSPAFTLATYVHLMPDDLPEPTFADISFNGVESATEDDSSVTITAVP
jgi:integrase